MHDRADQSLITDTSVSTPTAPSCRCSLLISKSLLAKLISPSDIVHILKSSLRAKGLHVGRWRLERNPSRIIITDLCEPGLDRHKYSFEMELGLKTTGRGRWNKLDMSTYSSINTATGEQLELSLKHQKPFYFSK